jgi:hypothetical protein
MHVLKLKKKIVLPDVLKFLSEFPQLTAVRIIAGANQSHLE